MKGLSLLQAITALTAVLALTGCDALQHKKRDQTQNSNSNQADLRITEEPYYKQGKMNQKMDTLINYLEKETGLKIEYIPSINYAHSQYLISNNGVDLLWSGSFGAVKALSQSNSIQPIAIKRKSFINVLLAKDNVLPGIQNQLTSEQPLQALKGQSVLFGADASGSSYLTPILEMKQQGVGMNDLKSCMHESHHNNRALILVDSASHAFAWLPGSSDNPLKFVPKDVQSKLKVIWTSPAKRNYFVLAAPHTPTVRPGSDIYKVQQALLALDQRKDDPQSLNNELGITGFDPPEQGPSWLSQTSGQWRIDPNVAEISQAILQHKACEHEHVAS